MRTLTLSANSLGIYDRCRAAYRYYKVVGRRAVRSQAGLIAGTAIHSAVQALNSGKPPAAQEAAIDAVLAEEPIPVTPTEYRYAPYLKDAVAAFRAELGTLFAGWKVEEVEAQGTIELGTVAVRLPLWSAKLWEDVQVLWEFRRDMVGVAPDGMRYVVDYKSSSRNEDVEYLASKNSGALMGYCWAYQAQHGKPVHGAQLVRIILRRPSKTGVMFEFPRDNPILFQPERLEEWRRMTLRKARELLERNPEDPEDWPLSSNTVGCCRHQFGACDFLAVCTLKPEDRPAMLASDAYEDADHTNNQTPPGSGAAGAEYVHTNGNGAME